MKQAFIGFGFLLWLGFLATILTKVVENSETNQEIESDEEEDDDDNGVWDIIKGEDDESELVDQFDAQIEELNSKIEQIKVLTADGELLGKTTDLKSVIEYLRTFQKSRNSLSNYTEYYKNTPQQQTDSSNYDQELQACLLKSYLFQNQTESLNFLADLYLHGFYNQKQLKQISQLNVETKIQKKPEPFDPKFCRDFQSNIPKLNEIYTNYTIKYNIQPQINHNITRGLEMLFESADKFSYSAVEVLLHHYQLYSLVQTPPSLHPSIAANFDNQKLYQTFKLRAQYSQIIETMKFIRTQKCWQINQKDQNILLMFNRIMNERVRELNKPVNQNSHLKYSSDDGERVENQLDRHFYDGELYKPFLAEKFLTDSIVIKKQTKIKQLQQLQKIVFQLFGMNLEDGLCESCMAALKKAIILVSYTLEETNSKGGSFQKASSLETFIKLQKIDLNTHFNEKTSNSNGTERARKKSNLSEKNKDISLGDRQARNQNNEIGGDNGPGVGDNQLIEGNNEDTGFEEGQGQGNGGGGGGLRNDNFDGDQVEQGHQNKVDLDEDNEPYQEGLPTELQQLSSSEIEFLQQDAALGNINSQIVLAEIYRNGYPNLQIPANQQKAIQYYEMAAQRGNLQSLYNLAILHLLEEKTEKNCEKILHYLEKSAKKNYVISYNGLGYIYSNGVCVTANRTTAASYFEKAANQNYTEAIANLANLYYSGFDDTPKNETKAIELWQRVVQESNQAQLYLAYMYTKNMDVGFNCSELLFFLQQTLNSGSNQILRVKGHLKFLNKDPFGSLYYYLWASLMGIQKSERDIKFILDQLKNNNIRCNGDDSQNSLCQLIFSFLQHLDGKLESSFLIAKKFVFNKYFSDIEGVQQTGIDLLESIKLKVPEAYFLMSQIYEYGIGVEQNITQSQEILRNMISDYRKLDQHFTLTVPAWIQLFYFKIRSSFQWLTSNIFRLFGESGGNKDIDL